MGLYSNEIENNLKDIKSFYGAIPKDKLDSLKVPMKKDFSCIINLENSNQGGSHWCALYNDRKEDFCEYFDSYGMKCPLEVIKFVKRNFRKPIYYNDNQLQQDTSKNCGYFCQYYIRSRASGKEPYDVLYSLKQEPCQYNEKKVISS